MAQPYQHSDEGAVKSNALCVYYFDALDKNQSRAGSLLISPASPGYTRALSNHLYVMMSLEQTQTRAHTLTVYDVFSFSGIMTAVEETQSVGVYRLRSAS